MARKAKQWEIFPLSYLINMVEITSFLRPVAMAHRHTIFCWFRQHHYDHASLFPYHLPKVGNCVWQGALRGDVSWIPGVVVGLK
jgi:hypothetical protein